MVSRCGDLKMTDNFQWNVCDFYAQWVICRLGIVFFYPMILIVEKSKVKMVMFAKGALNKGKLVNPMIMVSISILTS